MTHYERILGNQRRLNCESCGVQIGWLCRCWGVGGDEPNLAYIEAKCFSCAAVDEAEKIAGEAS